MTNRQFILKVLIPNCGEYAPNFYTNNLYSFSTNRKIIISIEHLKSFLSNKRNKKITIINETTHKIGYLIELDTFISDMDKTWELYHDIYPYLRSIRIEQFLK